MGKARDLFKKYDTTLDFETSIHLIDEGVKKQAENIRKKFSNML
jgi:hypothetical protein